MEDHQNAARLAVTAAFARGTPNFETHPRVASFQADVAVYHAQPHGNRDPLGQIVRPSHFVDVTDLIPKKRELLGCHESQAKWLDETQAMGSYLQTMENLNAEVGAFSGCFTYAEGWRQHLHLGFSAEGFDPLRDVLGNKCVLQQAVAKGR
jgi:LmbE family N-acetylglucosaminyl deacetylase